MQKSTNHLPPIRTRTGDRTHNLKVYGMMLPPTDPPGQGDSSHSVTLPLCVLLVRSFTSPPTLIVARLPGPQVNIDHFTKDITVKNLVEPSLSSFDVAQKRIHALMEKDSLPRFVRSELYQELLK